MAKRAIPAIKKYVVTLNDEERARLTTTIQTGKHPAFTLLRARILLKADSSEAGEGWSDSHIAEALDTSVDTVVRTRQRQVRPGPGACHRHRPEVGAGGGAPAPGRHHWQIHLLGESSCHYL